MNLAQALEYFEATLLVHTSKGVRTMFWADLRKPHRLEKPSVYIVSGEWKRTPEQAIASMLKTLNESDIPGLRDWVDNRILQDVASWKAEHPGFWSNPARSR